MEGGSRRRIGHNHKCTAGVTEESAHCRPERASEREGGRGCTCVRMAASDDSRLPFGCFSSPPLHHSFESRPLARQSHLGPEALSPHGSSCFSVVNFLCVCSIALLIVMNAFPIMPFFRSSCPSGQKGVFLRAWQTRNGLPLAFLFYLLICPLPCASNAPDPRHRGFHGAIKAIVVLVMENRSFDHMLGWLKRLNPEIDGVTGQEWNLINVRHPKSKRVYFKDDAEFVDPDPGHSYQAIHEQIFGDGNSSAYPAPMNGFAQQAESMEAGFSRTVMSGFRPEILSTYTSLAMEFAVCDRWFASVPSSTQPNRFYVHSATSHGEMSNVRRDLVEGFPQRTIFDSIEESGLTYGVYYQNIPATLFFKALRRLKSTRNFHKFELSFQRHAEEGKLPNYVVLEQRYFDIRASPANDDHPSHDVYQGQRLVKYVYETLRASPQWNEMLFIITYDEHGGFYDHVPTPVRNVPNPDGMDGHTSEYRFTFDRLGVRVPTIFVSPWINKGEVLHEPEGPMKHSQFEHSSLPATVKKIFNLTSDFLTARDAWAGTFESILSERETPRKDCPEKLPSPMWPLRSSAPNEDRKSSEFQEELVVLASQLIGDGILVNSNASMTVAEANIYVENAVASFMEAAQMQLDAGFDEMSFVDVKLASRLNKRGCRDYLCRRGIHNSAMVNLH